MQGSTEWGATGGRCTYHLFMTCCFYIYQHFCLATKPTPAYLGTHTRSFHVSSFFHIALQGLIVWQSSSFVNSRERIHHAAIHFEKYNSTDMITDHHADTPAMDDNGTVTASANTFSLCKNSTIHGWYYSAVFWQKTLLGQAWTMPLCRVSWAQICGGKTRQVLLQGYLPIPVGCWQLGGVTATQEGKKRWEIKYLITKKLGKYTL